MPIVDHCFFLFHLFFMVCINMHLSIFIFFHCTFATLKCTLTYISTLSVSASKSYMSEASSRWSSCSYTHSLFLVPHTLESICDKQTAEKVLSKSRASQLHPNRNPTLCSFARRNWRTVLAKKFEKHSNKMSREMFKWSMLLYIYF